MLDVKGLGLTRVYYQLGLGQEAIISAVQLVNRLKSADTSPIVSESKSIKNLVSDILAVCFIKTINYNYYCHITQNQNFKSQNSLKLLTLGQDTPFYLAQTSIKSFYFLFVSTQ